MNTKTVYQYDLAGMYIGTTDADESPLEPGVWLIPARCVEIEPPAVTGSQWPRWNGVAWQVITIQQQKQAAEESDPVAKLRDFLNSNPDVAALLQNDGDANV